MERMTLFLLAFSVFSAGCNQRPAPVSVKEKGPQGVFGCWHMFVPKEEKGPHHEYYDIRPDNSVIACFVAEDGSLIAKFDGKLDGDLIVNESGTLRFPLRLEGDSLVIHDKKDLVYSRVEAMPACCK